MSKNRKWWQPKNEKPGFLGVLHAVKNIPVEALRRLLNSIGANPMIGGKDLARRIIDMLVILLGILSLVWFISMLSGNPIGGPVRVWLTE